ncbi:hypothetical protein HK101_007097, partial [Irineochytrium annulatum]
MSQAGNALARAAPTPPPVVTLPVMHHAVAGDEDAEYEDEGSYCSEDEYEDEEEDDVDQGEDYYYSDDEQHDDARYSFHDEPEDGMWPAASSSRRIPHPHHDDMFRKQDLSRVASASSVQTYATASDIQHNAPPSPSTPTSNTASPPTTGVSLLSAAIERSGLRRAHPSLIKNLSNIGTSRSQHSAPTSPMSPITPLSPVAGEGGYEG